MTAAALGGDGGDARRAESPLGRLAVVFLASPEAEFASGSMLDLNGASYLRI
jgi:3-oxoacyl-[acyl-carrier protein] reductase